MMNERLKGFLIVLGGLLLICGIIYSSNQTVLDMCNVRIADLIKKCNAPRMCHDVPWMATNLTITDNMNTTFVCGITGPCVQ